MAILVCMGEPRLKILGVYRPVIGKDTWQKQWQVTCDDEATREHFEKLVLVEAEVEGVGDDFEMVKLGQMQPEHPDDRRWMQVGYDEGLLSSDGESLIQRTANCVKGTGILRFAVYLHLYDSERPLQWQGGLVDCPPVQDAPIRLMMMMPYNACS
jgi:hypothetical protein